MRRVARARSFCESSAAAANCSPAAASSFDSAARRVAYDRAAAPPSRRDGYVVVVENGRSTVRTVTVGRDVGSGRVEVLSGLSPGERLARPTR